MGQDGRRAPKHRSFVLASSSLSAGSLGPRPPWLKALADKHPGDNKNTLRHTSEAPDEHGSVYAVELGVGGRKRVYRKREGHDKSKGTWEGWDMVEAAQTTKGRLIGLMRSYLLPQGFPESVAPQYASYMGWRGVQYFFGGAISVYTTKSLLGALGVAGKFTGEASAAINWVIKDGAGRLGRLLFARWGRELDCELKQFRLAGDLLMEAGALLELSTIYMPSWFLPLACTANLAKNLAAVAASSTRAPIYRTFALQNNLADITAKGESVANLADILGTVAGILLSRAQGLPLGPTFCMLSAGYLLASRREVDSVELPYLNRARLGYSARAFLTSGQVPSVGEANHSEPLLPWVGFNQGRIVLGACVEQACAGPSEFRAVASSFKDQKYVLSYRPEKKKVYIMLQQGSGATDCLKAVFAAHTLLYMLDGRAPLHASLPGSSLAASNANGNHATAAKARKAASKLTATQPVVAEVGGAVVSKPAQVTPAAVASTIAACAKVVEQLYPEFVKQAERQGWKLSQTMLNPKETRLLHWTTPL